MKKLSFEKFSSNKVTAAQLKSISGGTCTGGGFTNYGGGNYTQWNSDESHKNGYTTYYGFKTYINGKPSKWKG